jgi:outer membrane protein TolC
MTSDLTISWQVDMWGKLADASNAARLDVQQQQFLTQSLRDSLAASVLDSWLALIAQQRAITIEQKRLTTLQQNESYIIQRYRNGLGTLNDLDTARTSTANSKASLEEIEQQFQQQSRDLTTLVGQLSQVTISLPSQFPQVALSHIALPEQTLRQRPDLKAAYLAIQSADLSANVAYKELLPSFSLQAALTDSANTIRDALFVSPVWSLLGQLTAPLYQGGELRAEAEIAELQTAYSYQSYRNTLLTAVNEVESAIDRERSLSRQLNHLNTALNSAFNNLEQYQKSYRTGLVDMLDLLTIQQQTYDIESQVNSTTYELLSNRVSLGLALGLEIKQ